MQQARRDGEPVSAPVGGDEFLLGETPGRLRRGEIVDDLRASWRPLLVVVAAGVPLGALWTLLTPVEHSVVLARGGTGSPTGEDAHAFDAIAVFVLLVTMFGIVVGAIAWRRRHRRGPVWLTTAAVGSLVAAWLAGRVGTWLAPTSSPIPVAVDRAAASGGTVQGPPLPAVLTTVPPSTGPWWIVIMAGLAAAMTYVVAALAEGHEDMSRDEP